MPVEKMSINSGNKKKLEHRVLLSAISEKFGFMLPRIADQIRKIENQDTLEALFRQVFRCADMAVFENVLRQVVADDDEKKP